MATANGSNDVDSFKNIETTALVVKEAKADFELTPIILDEVRGDEILIDMKYSGICELLQSTTATGTRRDKHRGATAVS